MPNEADRVMGEVRGSDLHATLQSSPADAQ
jgi:hypothetical protein